jgi:hypothetical protein
VKKTLFVFLVLVCQLLCAQIKQKEYYPVYVNYPDHSVKASIVSQNKKISIDRNLTYYWYSSNKIQETMGGVDGKMLHGLYSSFYLNGNLKEKGNFKSGLKNGQWTTWYENGKIKEIIIWKKGIRSNTTFNYNMDGELLSTTQYRKGKPNGYQLLYKNGVVYEKKKYRKGIEIIPVVKEKKEKHNKRSENTSRFSEKFKIISANLKERLSEFKIKRDNKKSTEGKEDKTRKQTKKAKEEKALPDSPKKTTKDKNAFSLKKKDSTEKQNQTKVSGK